MNGLASFGKWKLRFLNIRRNISNLNKVRKIESELLLKNNEKAFFKRYVNRYMETLTATQKKSKGKNNKMYVSALLITTGGLCGYQFYYQWSEKKNENCFLNDMQEISDTIFDNTDNIVLFVFNKNKVHEEKKKVLEIKEEIRKLGFSNMNYLYTYDSKDVPEYACFLYKGRRRMMLTEEELGKKSRVDVFRDFFKPVSENYEVLNKDRPDNVPMFVTHDTFQREVIEDSMKNKILLVLFENSCFLCFLYKPFINSLNKLFKENQIELRIKKYNIEKNDYAPNMIICRGTPTFLYYHNGEGNKWVEYKPSEIINKIVEITKVPTEVKNQMLELSEKLHARMHYFGYLTLWVTESRVLENMLLQKHIITPSYSVDENPEKGVKDKSTKLDEENIYNDVLTTLIEEDMSRNDMIQDSLEFTKGRIEEAEKNCYLVALMMAQELMDEENKKTENK